MTKGEDNMADITPGRKLTPEQAKTIDEFYRHLMGAKRIMTYYNCAMLETETKFKVLNYQFSLEQARNPIESIKTRLKSFESISEKLLRRGLPLTVESLEANLNDVAGVRVICPFVDDIYTIAECFLAQDDITLINATDYIKNPKENGYRSLHLIIEIPIYLQKEKRMMRVEVQLRTIAMDFWASLEHKMHYKKEIPESIAKELRDELRVCADDIAGLDVRMEKLRAKIEEAKNGN
ncbi:MAG: GTP pyrophosphokinase family protein [Ruminococcaceae bacterium]|nr:GTP pyrophosphokinase family protein [Oscillospiraceae bacterium]